MRILLGVGRGLALLVVPLGIIFAAASMEAPVGAADAPRARSWAELSAEREELKKQSEGLVAAGKIDEAVAVLDRQLACDRQMLTLQAATDAQKKAQQDAQQEIMLGLRWIVAQKMRREDWSAAAGRQREFADACDSFLGKSKYVAVDARINQAYLEKLAALPREDAHELVRARRDLEKVVALYGQGKDEEAIPLAENAIKVQQRLLGNSSPQLAASLSWLGHLYENRRDYASAEPLYRQAMEIRRRVLGEDHPDYAASLHDLAGMYDSQGDHAQAEPLYRRALAIQKKTLGENHPDYARTLNNLAVLYMVAQNDYARAEPLCREALEIRRKVFGENHPFYAASLHNLAWLYEAQGDYARAEPLYRQALDITKKSLGENHPDYAQSLNNLAGLYESQHDYARAERLYRQALAIRGKTLGENDPTYATALNNLAVLYMDQYDYARAEPLLHKVLQIRKKVLGENHPAYASSLENLAGLYHANGDDAAAAPLLARALAIKKKAVGENHRFYTLALNNLASVYKLQGNYSQAEQLLRQAVTVQVKHLESTAVIQSQRQQLAMLQLVRFYLNQYLDLAARDDQFSVPAYRLMLAWKGMVFRRERLARAGEQTPELAALFRQLQQVTGQLAQLAWAAPDPKQADGWRERIAKLSEKKEQLEAELSARSAAFRQARAPSTLEEIQAALPNDVVLVDFLEFPHGERSALPPRGELGIRLEQTDKGSKITELLGDGAAARDGRLQPGDLILEISDQAGKWTATAGKPLQDIMDLMIGDVGSRVALRVQRAGETESREIALVRTQLRLQRKTDWKWEHEYTAFVVHHDGPAMRINLGPAQPIIAAIDAWRQTYGTSQQSAAAGRLLREKIWGPIAAQIHDAKIVLLSPDGALSRLPFGALPGKEAGKYLIEEYPLAIVPTAQIIPEIVRQPTRKPLPGNLLLVGNIDYDGQPGQQATVSSGPKPAGQNPPQALWKIHFNRLPATQGEVASIEKLYHQDFGATGLQTLEERQATKAAFLAAAGRYRYLHLATHGFFIQENPSPSATQAQRGAEPFGGPQSADLNVGLLSGLALAGANRAGKAANVTADGPADNGILTAEEIRSLNLDGVQLVMLSACETGLGKAAGGEGLLGLQRSFQAAGARSVVASLWKVPDEETKALMGAFYTNLWQRKLSPLESLRQAQLAMLRNYDSQVGVLRAPDFSQTAPLPKAGPPEKPATGRTRLSPASWAAFVLSGDWR